MYVAKKSSFLNLQSSCINLQSFFLKRFYINGVLHGHGFSQMIIEHHLYVIHTGDNVSAGLTKQIDGKRNVRPVGMHSQQSSLQAAFFGSRLGYRLEFQHVIAQTVVENLIM